MSKESNDKWSHKSNVLTVSAIGSSLDRASLFLRLKMYENSSSTLVWNECAMRRRCDFQMDPVRRAFTCVVDRAFRNWADILSSGHQKYGSGSVTCENGGSENMEPYGEKEESWKRSTSFLEEDDTRSSLQLKRFTSRLWPFGDLGFWTLHKRRFVKKQLIYSLNTTYHIIVQ